jgi:hypothetical protein
MMKAQTVVAVWILVAGAAMAQAQTGIWMGVGPAPRSAAVKDAPFSADLVSINDHAEGRPGINTEFHGKVARNSQGETYFAMQNISPFADHTLPTRATITNPAALTVTTLDLQSKTAFVSHVNPKALNTAPHLTPGASPTANGKPAGATAVVAPGTSTKTESLGTKEMDGLRVLGFRTIHTAFSPGKDAKPFVSTVDTWTSPQLKAVVMVETTTSNGDHHVTKLQNIVRTEPSAALFQIPSDYSVHDNAPMATNTR